MIYGWLSLTLPIWDIYAFSMVFKVTKKCHKSSQISVLNMTTMTLFYFFVCIPYLGLTISLPHYLYGIYKTHNNMRRRNLSRHFLIKSMPSIPFSKKLFQNKSIQSDISECLICLDPFREGEDYVTPLACNAMHVFHSNCIEEWLTKD